MSAGPAGSPERRGFVQRVRENRGRGRDGVAWTGYNLAMPRRTALMALPLLLGLAGSSLTAGPAAAASRSCPAIKDPYKGTRYEGVPLNGIKASGLSCASARKVVKGAHLKGLGLTPPPSSGVRRYTWNGWRVAGDLRPESDKYTARKGGMAVRWRF